MSVLGIIRLSAYGSTSLFALITLCLSAHFISLYTGVGFPVPSFSGVALAASIMTLLSLPAFIIIDMKRTGVFTSMIAVEMVTNTILWVMWIISGSLASRATGGISVSCGGLTGEEATACNEYNSIEAFSFLNFIALLIYSFILLVFTLIAVNRGHSVWTQSVKETNFFAPPVNPPPGSEPEKFVGGVTPQITGQPYPYPPNQFAAPGQPYMTPPPQPFTPPPQGFATPPPQGFAPPPQTFSPPPQTFTPPPQQVPVQQYPPQPGYPPQGIPVQVTGPQGPYGQV